eukprot:TRINITY_DN1537_c0_g1_i5.p1 TRINITY_DN1537_c0_g1~~TRINITY_DN1537_c0_g1_i5.p1  ORF type:complete len:214 (-),score=37.20 TRINITY_DN1537_c0_g1_i5:170-811(-)
MGKCFMLYPDTMVSSPGFVMVYSIGDFLFWVSYSIFVIFWANVICTATNTESLFKAILLPGYLGCVVMVFCVELTLWLLLVLLPSAFVAAGVVLLMFSALIFFGTAIGFAVAGGKIFSMVRVTPPSRGRTAKMREILLVTIFCAIFLVIRALVSSLMVTPLGSYLENNLYLEASVAVVSELVPSLVLIVVLRKIPWHKSQQMSQPLNTQPTDT